MFNTFVSDGADDLWLAIATDFKNGKSKIQQSRSGITKEILHATLSIENPRDRWIVSRTPAINPAFAIVEVIWILRGRQDSIFLNYFNNSLPNYSGHTSVYHGSYGYRLRNKFGIDQIHEAYQVLNRNPESRQVVLQIWESTSDLPDREGIPRSADIPCNICSILKVRDSCLEWTQVMRSNDFFRGLPFNIIQFTMLQEIIASWLKLDVGSYNHISDSLHLYESDSESINGFNKIVSPPNTDRFLDDYESSEIALSILENLTMDCINKEITSDHLVSSVEKLNISACWKNMASILVAEACRRRRSSLSVRESLNQCSNPLLIFLFERWEERILRKTN